MGTASSIVHSVFRGGACGSASARSLSSVGSVLRVKRPIPPSAPRRLEPGTELLALPALCSQPGVELLPMPPLCELGAELLSMPALLEPGAGLLSMPAKLPCASKERSYSRSRCFPCVRRERSYSRCLPGPASARSGATLNACAVRGPEAEVVLMPALLEPEVWGYSRCQPCASKERSWSQTYWQSAQSQSQSP